MGPVELDGRRVPREPGHVRSDARGHDRLGEQLAVEDRCETSASTALRAHDATARRADRRGPAVHQVDALHAIARLDLGAAAVARRASTALSSPEPPTGTGKPWRWPSMASNQPNAPLTGDVTSACTASPRVAAAPPRHRKSSSPIRSAGRVRKRASRRAARLPNRLSSCTGPRTGGNAVKSDRRSGSSISSHWLHSSSQAGPSAGWNALNPPAVRSRSVCRTADRVGALEQADVPARVRKHGGRDQAVLPAANDDGVRDTAHHDGPGRVMRAAPAGTPRSTSPRTCRGYPILRVRPAIAAGSGGSPRRSRGRITTCCGTCAATFTPGRRSRPDAARSQRPGIMKRATR
jgi:hypothetical protein